MKNCKQCPATVVTHAPRHYTRIMRVQHRHFPTLSWPTRDAGVQHLVCASSTDISSDRRWYRLNESPDKIQLGFASVVGLR